MHPTFAVRPGAWRFAPSPPLARASVSRRRCPYMRLAMPGSGNDVNATRLPPACRKQGAMGQRGRRARAVGRDPRLHWEQGSQGVDGPQRQRTTAAACRLSSQVAHRRCRLSSQLHPVLQPVRRQHAVAARLSSGCGLSQVAHHRDRPLLLFCARHAPHLEAPAARDRHHVTLLQLNCGRGRGWGREGVTEGGLVPAQHSARTSRARAVVSAPGAGLPARPRCAYRSVSTLPAS